MKRNLSTQTFVTRDLSTMTGIFLIRSQILLLHTLTELAFNKVEALTELNFVEVTKILSRSRLVFFPFGDINSNISQNVLCLHSKSMQEIF